MRGHNMPSFLPMKPAPREDKEEQMRPKALELLIYSSIDYLSGRDKL